MSMYISLIKQKEKEEREKLEGKKREYECFVYILI